MNLIVNIISNKNAQTWHGEKLFHIARFDFHELIISSRPQAWGTSEDWEQLYQLIGIDARMKQQAIETLTENTEEYFSTGQIHWFYTEEKWFRLARNKTGRIDMIAGIFPNFERVFGLWLPMPTTIH